ncbi:GGDEF domain-containing protein [Mesorhizobium sp. KR1-2]|uniref:GGDEF domain-containing protein n=1 Tax=Mesorhizobium sp. KR1-2 TaxID=3156609 RepID=UPI0032B3AA4B
MKLLQALKGYWSMAAMVLLFGGYLAFEVELYADSADASPERERNDLMRLLAVSSVMMFGFMILYLRRFVEFGRESIMRKDAELRARAIERTDLLTGLANRLRFEEQVADALLQCAKDGEQGAALFIDLDGFKPVNDTHGHASGDAVLREVALRLTQNARSAVCIARFGGDEFAVFAKTSSGVPEAMRMASDLLDAIEKPIVFEGKQLAVSATIGVTICTGADMQSAAELLKAADSAMYAGKRSGRSQVVLYGSHG